MLGGKTNGIAYVVAANMGYGHERPANVLRHLSADNKIIVANSYEGIPNSDRNIWEGTRKMYERISRFKRIPVIGSAVFWVMDEVQRIPEFYPRRDLSRPSLQLRELYALINHRSHMRHLISELAKDPKPLICTFSPPAFAAEEFGYPEEIYCLCTDADVSRAWAPLKSKKTRIKYFAPNGRVAERLKLYGVPEKNIELTGFPLPTELIGGAYPEVALKNMKRRICTLDPNGIFSSHNGDVLVKYFGAGFCGQKLKKPKTINLAFAIGGAGAQREIGIVIAKSLKQKIQSQQIILHLIAGTRSDVNDYFIEELREAGLFDQIGKGIRILFEEDRKKYFDEFTKLMGKIDILWTKPSELSFYTGLGLPIIMAPPVGSQEDYNHKWLEQVGGGIDQFDPRYTNEWLFDWINSGSLARMAWNGFIEAPTHGAYRIEDIIRGNRNTIHDLPLVV